MEDSLGWYIKGIRLFQIQQFKHAREAFQKAFSLNPEHTYLLSNIAKCYFNEGDTTLALQFAREAIQQDPEQAEAHHIAALAYFNLRFYNKSEDHINIALTIDAEEPSFYLAAFSTQMALDKLAEAENSIQRAAQLAPNDPDVLYYQAFFWQKMDQPQKAKRFLEAAIKQNPTIDYQHNLAGDIALSSEDKKMADYHLKEAIRLNPNDKAYRKDLLDAPLRKNRISNALYYHHFAVANFPLIGQYLYFAIWFGICFFILGAPDSFISVVFKEVSFYLLPLFSLYVAFPPVFRLIRSWQLWGRHSIQVDAWEVLLFTGLQIAIWSGFYFVFTSEDHFFSICLFLLPIGFFACASVLLPQSWQKKWFQSYIVLLYTLGLFNVTYKLLTGIFFPHLAQGLFIGICSLIILFVVCIEADSKKQKA